MEDLIEVRIKNTPENQIEEEIKVGIKDLLENQMEDEVEISINDSLTNQMKVDIEIRIKESLKSQIKYSLEESMIKIQECDELINIIKQIKFNFSNEELCRELYGENRIILSIIYIAEEKKQRFSYENMKVFCLCFENLIEKDFLDDKITKSEIENLFKKVCLFVFQDVTSEANFMAHMEEANMCTALLSSTLERQAKYVNDFNEKIDFVVSLFKCISFMKQIISLTSYFINDFITFESLTLTITDLLETIKSFKGYQEFNLYDLNCVLLVNYLNNFFNDKNPTDDIEIFISSIYKPIILNQALEMALKYDKYMRLLLQKIKENENIRDLKSIRKSFTNDYKNLIEHYEKNYKNTPSKTLPDINELLCIGLNNFVKNSLGNGFKDAFVFNFRNNKEQGRFTLSSLIRRIDALPTQVQYFVAEIMAKLRKNEVNWFYFIIEKVHKGLVFEEMSQEWATEYVELACSPPYCTFLSKFKQEEEPNDLRKLLEDITPKIILMDLPEKVYSRCFYNSSIVLKLFMNSKGRKGATFVLYLHELANFLQRSKCGTIGPNENQKSFSKFELREGGYLLEREIFGTCLYYITEEAADYIVSIQVDQDHEQFKKMFNKKNTLCDGKMPISLHRSSNMVLLGECGSRFRSPSKNAEKGLSAKKAKIKR